MAGKMTIGAGLGVDGEKEFKKAISGINQDMKVLSSEMKKVTAAFDDNDNSMESLTSQAKVYNKQIDTQKQKITTLEKALENAKKEYGENSSQVKNWQRQLNYAEADLSNTERALKKTTKKIDELGNEASTTGDQLQQTSNSTGILSESFSNLGNRLGLPISKLGAIPKSAMIAVGAIAGITAACVLLVKKLTEAGKKAGEFADDIITLSTKTRVSTESLQEYAYYSELVDVSMETFGSSLGKLIKSMATAQSGTGEQAKAFAKLGVSITDANGNLRDSNDVFAETIDALGQIENETEADAIASQIFGRSFQELNPLVAVGSEGMKNFSEEARKMGSNLSGDAIATLGELDNQYRKVDATQTNMTNAIGSLVAPMQVKVVAAVASMIGGMAASLNEGELLTGEFAETVKEGLTNLVQSITDNLPQFLDVGLKLVGNILLGIGKSLPDIIPMIIQVVLSMVDTIISNIPLFVDAAAQIVSGLALGLVNAIPALVAMIPILITSLVTAIVGSVQTIVQAGIQLLTALVGALPEIITTIIEVIPEIISAIVTALTESVPIIIQAGIELFIALIEALPEIINAIVEAIPQIIDAVVDAVIGSIPQLIDAGVDLFIALVANLPTIILEILKAIPEIITSIVTGIVSAVPQIAEAGLQLIQGLWEGILNAKDWLVGKISEFFDGIVDSIKSFFGIESPSKLFEEEIGNNLAFGIGEGFKGSMSKVSRDMQKSLDSLNTDVTASLNVNGTKQAGGNVVNLTVYAQSLSDAEINKLVYRLNREFGGAMA